MKKVALIVPCFNESNRFKIDYWKSLASLPGTDLIFVNDGSTDQTKLILEKFSRDYGSRVIHLPENVGKSNAVRRGLLSALNSTDQKYHFVGFIDADGAFSTSDVASFIFESERIAEIYESIWSSRVALSGRKIDRKSSRHFIGRIVASTLSLKLKIILPYDTQSGLKLFTRSDELLACLNLPFKTRWLFEIELILRWNKKFAYPLKIWEWPVNYWTDVRGSKINFVESLRIFKELLIIFNYKF
jgi:glycosyltransferase involved in cell wall biosynthesis